MSARMRISKLLNKPRRKPRQPPPIAKWNILRGDKVQVVGDHPEAGKQGVVREVIRKNNRVLIEGVNIVARNIKGDKDRGIKGRSIQIERPIPYANVNLVDPITGKPTRISRTFLEDGTKVRVAKKSGAVIPRPDILTFRRRPINHIATESDTLDKDVWEVTYSEYQPLSPSAGKP